jgi:hypothetical protein
MAVTFLTNEDLAVINGKLTTIQNNHSNLASEVSTLANRLDNHADAIESLQDEVDNIEISMMKHIALRSSTPGSEKRFFIVVDDSGNLSTVPVEGYDGEEMPL